MRRLLSSENMEIRRLAALGISLLGDTADDWALADSLESSSDVLVTFTSNLPALEPDQRENIVRRCRDLAAGGKSGPRIPAMTALLHLGDLPLPAILYLVRSELLTNSPQVSRGNLLEALTHRFEPAAWEKLTQTFTSKRAINSATDVVEILKAEGWTLQGTERLSRPRRIPEGKILSARLLLYCCDAREGFTVEGTTIRFDQPLNALDAWRKRLSAK